MNASICHAALIAVALLLSLSSATFAISAELKYIEANDRISDGSKTTYVDLALQFAPGLARNPADGRALSQIRHIGGEESLATITSPSIGGIERVDIELAGKPRMILLIDFGQADDSAEGVSILALYDMAGAPRLLDAMNVGLDRENSFNGPRFFALSSEFGMAFVRSSHHNAGEEYVQASMIGVWGDKLHAVDTIFSMSWNAGSEQVEARVSFGPVEGAVAFDAIVDVRTTSCDGGCEVPEEAPAKTERLTARYSWDETTGKFVRPAHALDRIPLPDMDE